jgi:pilus assembly protein CpaE
MLVLNKADSRLGIRAESIEGQIRHKVSAQIGNAPYEMTLALNQGVPLVIDRRNHPIARDVMALAALTANALNPAQAEAAPAAATSAPAAAPVTAETSKGLFGRLLTKR